MKRYICITVLFAVAVVVAGSAGFAADQNKQAAPVLSVRDIEKNGNTHKGTIIVTGVVARVIKGKEPPLFAIIDTSEARSCKSTGCARFYLPIKYTGPTPREWDEINVTGSLTEGKRSVFEATRVEVLRHLTFGDK